MEDIIQLHDKKFKVMIPAAKIDEAVEAVARRINHDYADKETPLFLGILLREGSFLPVLLLCLTILIAGVIRRR